MLATIVSCVSSVSSVSSVSCVSCVIVGGGIVAKLKKPEIDIENEAYEDRAWSFDQMFST